MHILIAVCVLASAGAAVAQPPWQDPAVREAEVAWARPPTSGPGGAGLRARYLGPAEAVVPHVEDDARTPRVIGLLRGRWGAGIPEVEAGDVAGVGAALSLLRQVLRIDTADLAGRAWVYVSPGGPRKGPGWQFDTDASDPTPPPLAPSSVELPPLAGYAWEFRGDLVLCDGQAVPTEGRIDVVADVIALALRVRDGQVAPDGFHRLAPIAVFAWPYGLEGVGLTAARSDPPAWGTGPLRHAQVLDWMVGRSWPFLVESSMNGEWLHMSVRADHGRVGRPGIDSLFGAGESPHRGTGLASTLPYRPRPWALRGLGPQTPDLMLGPVLNVFDPAPDLTPTVERCVATLPPEARAVGPPARRAWGRAQVGPAPGLVKRYLERPDLPESVTIACDTPDGRRAMGLLRLGGVPGDLRDAHVWWTLGRDCLTVTVLPWNTGREGLEKRFRTEEDSALLTGLFGWRGRSVSVVPSTMGPVGDSEWISLVPDPDHEVGLLERVRVDQTEWGRCRVYKGYGIYHIVFDLLPEDVAQR